MSKYENPEYTIELLIKENAALRHELEKARTKHAAASRVIRRIMNDYQFLCDVISILTARLGGEVEITQKELTEGVPPATVIRNNAAGLITITAKDQR